MIATADPAACALRLISPFRYVLVVDVVVDEQPVSRFKFKCSSGVVGGNPWQRLAFKFHDVIIFRAERMFKFHVGLPTVFENVHPMKPGPFAVGRCRSLRRCKDCDLYLGITGCQSFKIKRIVKLVAVKSTYRASTLFYLPLELFYVSLFRRDPYMCMSYRRFPGYRH